MVAEKFVRDLGLDRDKVNVNGGHLPLTRESSIFLRAGVGQGGSGLLTPSVVTTAARISAHASLKR